MKKRYEEYTDADWARLNGWDWRWLLRAHPQFAGKCDFTKLNGWDWCWLLTKQPQFAGKCDFTKLSDDEWYWLLMEQPQLAVHRGKNTVSIQEDEVIYG